MSLFWLKARCLHTANLAQTQLGEGKKKSTRILRRKALSFLVLHGSSDFFFFFLVLRGMLLPHIKWTRHFIQAIIT